MRKINKYTALLIFGVVALSCSEEKLIDEVFQTTDRGLVLRTVAVSGTTFNLFDTTSTFSTTLEVQDKEGGDLLSAVDVYVSFVDNGTAGAETLLSSFPADSFTDGPFGLPRGDVIVSFSELLTALGLQDGDYDNLDVFSLRLVAKLTDGREFTNNANGTVTGGTFFTSPFAYNISIACIPLTPFTGDYTLDIVDSFGDGWDGAFITVDIDGTSTDYTTNGTGDTFVINVPDGTSSLTFSYTAGNFEGEHSYTLIAPTGETAASDGPGPAPGEIVLNICGN
ncbi:MAG: hypothetical protein ACR2MT_03980 [Aurantibacter sp.]